DDREAYGNLNMGAGFARFVASADAERTVDVARGAGVSALVAGRVDNGPKRAIIEPLQLTFSGDDLHVRA
ncbi:MAG: phosphoribosylformylglycinamidine cyclo-ligase, partial [Burkholderiaceae bacterium]|nr:phosphoribosylformylglycinamidine cyclo-ligase [Burkholderiaceae bacterium]